MTFYYILILIILLKPDWVVVSRYYNEIASKNLRIDNVYVN